MRPYRAVVLLMLVARLVQWDDMSFSGFAESAMLAFAILALYLGACSGRPPLRRQTHAVHEAA
jgi:hypothetical protein